MALGATVSAVHAQTATPDPHALPPELAALLAATPRWSSSVAADGAIGYKDNLLLSHAGGERSAFARLAVEALVLHLPNGRTDYFGFVNAEARRYFSGDAVDHEAQAVAQAEWRYEVKDMFKFAFDLKGYHLDQIFDVSDTDVRRDVAALKLSGAAAGPTLRWTIRPGWWLEAEALGKRETYEDGLNNSRIGDGALRVGWTCGTHFEVSVTAAQRARDFDRRVQYTAGGRERDGTHLRIREREAESRFDVTWDAAARWKTRTRAGVLWYADNGSGYFDYRQRKVAQELEWHSGNWAVQIEGSAKRLDFDVQTVGIGIFPPRRVKDEFAAQLRIERKVTERWTLFAEYSWERSRSNDPFASYVVNEGLLGARWSWEK